MAHQRRHTRRMRRTGTTFTAGQRREFSCLPEGDDRLTMTERIIKDALLGGWARYYSLVDFYNRNPARLMAIVHDTKQCVLEEARRHGTDSEELLESFGERAIRAHMMSESSGGGKCLKEMFYGSFPYDLIDCQRYGEMREMALGRTSYGTRGVPDEECYAFYWSNGARAWLVEAEPRSSKNKRFLDANEFMVPLSWFKTLGEARMMAYVLPPLPLYHGSIEATERGEVTTAERYQMWLAGKPSNKKLVEKIKERGSAAGPIFIPPRPYDKMEEHEDRVKQR